MSPCKRKLIFCASLIFFLAIFFINILAYRVSASETLPTSVSIMLVCGDGMAEEMSGEVCDPGDPLNGVPIDIGTSTCPDFNDIFGNPFASGDLGCLADCTGFSTSTCFTCGNGVIEHNEQCDTQDFGNQTCITLGYESGTLACSPACVIVPNCEIKESEGGVEGSGSRGGSSGGTSGFQPGANEEQVTKVIVRGKSYPNADVHMLVDGKVVGIVETDAKADFYFETSDIPAGVASFGFWSEDIDGLKSTLLTLTFRVISGAVTTITGVYIAPTIDIDKKSVRQGEPVVIYGQTVPETEVKVHINSEVEFVELTNSEETGKWQLTFDTAPLEEDFHTAKALFQIAAGDNIIQSGFSKAVSFAVGKVGGEAVCPEADLNADGRVNLTDFSILLYNWGTDNECSDQNQNGTVDLIDFSIMMYYWTG